jgi:hypothetical protein
MGKKLFDLEYTYFTNIFFAVSFLHPAVVYLQLRKVMTSHITVMFIN